MFQTDPRAVHIVLVTSNENFRQELHARLDPMRWNISDVKGGAEALDRLHLEPDIEVVLLDPSLPDLLPVELCRMVAQRFPRIEILTMDTATCHVLAEDVAPTSFAGRLADLLDVDTKQPLQVLPKPPEYARNPSGGRRLRGMIGESPAMYRAYALTHMVASRNTTVLITGESGTGKDLVAQAIHEMSPRRQAPFVVVNCAAIPEALLESELFGYAKGAFTGAMQSRIGRIHAAQSGTLFLDEIGELPLALQGKLLRFVELGEVQRLGSNENIRVDVRIVAATNADLKSLVKQKLFREDLYYRLAIFPISLVPLRDRGNDIDDIILFFTSTFSPGVQITGEAMDLLRRHTWPGNVRELRNVIERASILAGTAQEIAAKDILI